ncbi:hypothetical protein TR51_20635 [Kitasatospora griseola]|uniref:Uncharacterized protein n=1 Tax=Kitasatospora griseola TaxID=2064 RepID=A0A0D0PH41_KITGR|nr:hypothetical protein TR51_20635 [Kitasatospora griseola]
MGLVLAAAAVVVGGTAACARGSGPAPKAPPRQAAPVDTRAPGDGVPPAPTTAPTPEAWPTPSGTLFSATPLTTPTGHPPTVTVTPGTRPDHGISTPRRTTRTPTPTRRTR